MAGDNGGRLDTNAAVCLASVGVADGHGEEVDEPPGRSLVRGAHGRKPVRECGERRCRVGLSEFLSHENSCLSEKFGKALKNIP